MRWKQFQRPTYLLATYFTYFVLVEKNPLSYLNHPPKPDPKDPKDPKKRFRTGPHFDLIVLKVTLTSTKSSNIYGLHKSTNFLWQIYHRLGSVLFILSYFKNTIFMWPDMYVQSQWMYLRFRSVISWLQDRHLIAILVDNLARYILT
jgi:hypothetical protein